MFSLEENKQSLSTDKCEVTLLEAGTGSQGCALTKN